MIAIIYILLAVSALTFILWIPKKKGINTKNIGFRYKHFIIGLYRGIGMAVAYILLFTLLYSTIQLIALSKGLDVVTNLEEITPFEITKTEKQ